MVAFASSSTLSSYEPIDLTPSIGTEFSSSFQLSSLLEPTVDDEKDRQRRLQLQELATLVSQRGVVFFRAQDATLDQQKQLVLRISEFGDGETGRRPKTSGLHVHPISEETSELAKDISVISSQGGIARRGL